MWRRIEALACMVERSIKRPFFGCPDWPSVQLHVKPVSVFSEACVDQFGAPPARQSGEIVVLYTAIFLTKPNFVKNVYRADRRSADRIGVPTARQSGKKVVLTERFF